MSGNHLDNAKHAGADERPCADGCGRVRVAGEAYCGPCAGRRKRRRQAARKAAGPR